MDTRGDGWENGAEANGKKASRADHHRQWQTGAPARRGRTPAPHATAPAPAPAPALGRGGGGGGVAFGWERPPVAIAWGHVAWPGRGGRPPPNPPFSSCL